MEPTQCSETSAFNTQTPGKYPEDILSLSLIFTLLLFSKEQQHSSFALDVKGEYMNKHNRYAFLKLPWRQNAIKTSWAESHAMGFRYTALYRRNSSPSLGLSAP
jgi:hypothetical protein